MNSTPPDAKEMDAILAYLPIFDAPGFEPIVRWNGGRDEATKVITLPWPTYEPSVQAFFHALSEDYWRDDNYNEGQATSRMIRDPERIGCASLEEIRAMLTFCVRGERFCDGLWGKMIKQGVIRRILARLRELRMEMQAP